MGPTNAPSQKHSSQSPGPLATPGRSLPEMISAFVESVEEKKLQGLEPARILKRFLQGAEMFTTITEHNAFSGRPKTSSSAVDELLESAQTVVEILTDYEAAAAVAFEEPENALCALAHDVLGRVSADPSKAEEFLAEVEKAAANRAFAVLGEVQGGRRLPLARHLTDADLVEAVQMASEQAALWLPAELKRWLHLEAALGTAASDLGAQLEAVKQDLQKLLAPPDPSNPAGQSGAGTLSLSYKRAAKRAETYSEIVERDEEQDRALLSILVPALNVLIAHLHEPANDAWIKAHASPAAQGKVAAWEQRILRHRLMGEAAQAKK